MGKRRRKTERNIVFTKENMEEAKREEGNGRSRQEAAKSLGTNE
jgi:hypothetical protein